MATLTDLSVEVLEKMIFPHLKFNDLLRIRRVSKQLKKFTDAYVWKDASQVGEMEITEETGRDISALMTSGIIPSKLFIKNPSGFHFYANIADQDLTKFVENVAPFITNLRVLEISIYPTSKEWTFLSGLVNLETFEATYYGNGGSADMNITRADEDNRMDLNGALLPREWINGLRELRIGHNPNYRMVFDMMQRYVAILEQFVNLRQVCIPYLSFDPDGNTGFVSPSGTVVAQHTFNMQFQALGALADHHRLRIVDFSNLYYESSLDIDFLNRGASDAIFNFFDAIEMSPGRIKNVNSFWFQDFNSPLFDFEFGSLVRSFVNLLPGVMNLDIRMPNLCEIDIRQTSRSSVEMFLEDMRPEWPTLTKLQLHVNSTTSSVEPFQDTTMIYRFFWDNHIWPQIMDLTLSFEQNMDLPIPNTNEIVSAMPNLTRLKLINWNGTSDDVTRFWSGLPHLAEVVLDSCATLDDKCFLGGVSREPIFLQLQELKKLSLDGLDQMPGITDKTFTNVFAQMQLTHFKISSDVPLTKVTKNGLMALVNGNFNQTIEFFQVQGWSTADMSGKELALLWKRFRSSCRV